VSVESGREGRLRYSQCWEDVDCARAALEIRPGNTVLAIGAAGDNVLAMLQDEPGRIIAVDSEPAQCALIKLKLAAARVLDPDEVAPFLCEGDAAAARYARIRPQIGASAQRYWEQHSTGLERGVIHTGRFERYLALFRRWLLRWVPGGNVVRAMLAASSVEEQQRIYRMQWDSALWRGLFCAFFSRRFMALRGRDPAYFTHSEVHDVAEHYRKRARLALTALPLSTNSYVTYILSGRYDTAARTPAYLLPEVVEQIRPRLDRVEVRNASVTAVLRDCPDATVDAFYLSDVFELFDEEAYAETLAEVARVGRPGARICYWNNLVSRQRPERLSAAICSHADLGERLYQGDRSFLYSRFVVESVKGRAS